MLKLNASYSKKVPAESEYSSQQYHCQIEVELPDGLNPQQLQEKVHGVFDFVRNSVEAELHNAPVQQQQQPVQQPVQQAYNAPQQNYQQQPQQSQPQQQYQQNRQYSQNRQYRSSNATASAKQVNYLLSLVKRAGWTVQQLLQRCQVQTVEQIPSKMCSDLIQEFSGAAA